MVTVPDNDFVQRSIDTHTRGSGEHTLPLNFSLLKHVFRDGLFNPNWLIIGHFLRLIINGCQPKMTFQSFTQTALDWTSLTGVDLPYFFESGQFCR